jgi:pantothenate kinase
VQVERVVSLIQSWLLNSTKPVRVKEMQANVNKGSRPPYNRMNSLPDYTSEYLHERSLSPPRTGKNYGVGFGRTTMDDDSDTLSRLQSMKIKTENNKKEPFIIGVAGGSASGKTTVCNEIVESLSNKRVCVISQDSFYRSLSAEEKQMAASASYDFDHPGKL